MGGGVAGRSEERTAGDRRPANAAIFRAGSKEEGMGSG